MEVLLTWKEFFPLSFRGVDRGYSLVVGSVSFVDMEYFLLG